jgi:hypothetical protein
MTRQLNKYEYKRKCLITRNEIATKTIDEKMLDLAAIFETGNFKVLDFNQGGFDKQYKPNLEHEDVIENLELRIQKSKTFYPYIILDPIRISNSNALILMDTLEEFYENRTTEYQHFLIIEHYQPNYLKVKPQSGDVACLITNQEEKEKLYNIYLKEFTDFTAFIKQKINAKD